MSRAPTCAYRHSDRHATNIIPLDAAAESAPEQGNTQHAYRLGSTHAHGPITATSILL